MQGTATAAVSVSGKLSSNLVAASKVSPSRQLAPHPKRFSFSTVRSRAKRVFMTRVGPQRALLRAKRVFMTRVGAQRALPRAKRVFMTRVGPQRALRRLLGCQLLHAQQPEVGRSLITRQRDTFALR